MFPEYFENYYARIGREPGSFFALGRTDGAVLARFPAIDRDIRLDPRGPIGKMIAANPTAGLITVTSPTDGIERRSAIGGLPNIRSMSAPASRPRRYGRAGSPP